MLCLSSFSFLSFLTLFHHGILQDSINKQERMPDGQSASWVLLFQTLSSGCHAGSLKSAMTRIFTLWKLQTIQIKSSLCLTSIGLPLFSFSESFILLLFCVLLTLFTSSLSLLLLFSDLFLFLFWEATNNNSMTIQRNKEHSTFS